ncbi:MAG TPA: DedA family protein [Candidatus Binatia bacterium]|nr:DedA family protein [Candidatus Binatia bacterium]
MLETLLAPVTKFVLALISGWGYAGIVVCMTIESACIPLPSEIIMPFSGYLVSTGRFTLWGVALAGAVGNVFGSWIGYALGLAGGRPLAERLSRWRILRVAEYDRANGWLVRHGTQVAFWTRLLPIVRTFISFPAGAARVPLGRFTLYTFLGSFLWALGLAWIGASLGAHWEAIRGYARGFDLVIALGLVALFLLWLRSHLRSS